MIRASLAGGKPAVPGQQNAVCPVDADIFSACRIMYFMMSLGTSVTGQAGLSSQYPVLASVLGSVTAGQDQGHRFQPAAVTEMLKEHSLRTLVEPACIVAEYRERLFGQIRKHRSYLDAEQPAAHQRIMDLLVTQGRAPPAQHCLNNILYQCRCYLKLRQYDDCIRYRAVLNPLLDGRGRDPSSFQSASKPGQRPGRKAEKFLQKVYLGLYISQAYIQQCLYQEGQYLLHALAQSIKDYARGLALLAEDPASSLQQKVRNALFYAKYLKLHNNFLLSQDAQKLNAQSSQKTSFSLLRAMRAEYSRTHAHAQQLTAHQELQDSLADADNRNDSSSRGQQQRPPRKEALIAHIASERNLVRFINATLAHVHVLLSINLPGSAQDVEASLEEVKGLLGRWKSCEQALVIRPELISCVEQQLAAVAIESQFSFGALNLPRAERLALEAGKCLLRQPGSRCRPQEQLCLFSLKRRASALLRICDVLVASENQAQLSQYALELEELLRFALSLRTKQWLLLLQERYEQLCWLMEFLLGQEELAALLIAQVRFHLLGCETLADAPDRAHESTSADLSDNLLGCLFLAQLYQMFRSRVKLSFALKYYALAHRLLQRREESDPACRSLGFLREKILCNLLYLDADRSDCSSIINDLQAETQKSAQIMEDPFSIQRYVKATKLLRLYYFGDMALDLQIEAEAIRADYESQILALSVQISQLCQKHAEKQPAPQDCSKTWGMDCSKTWGMLTEPPEDETQDGRVAEARGRKSRLERQLVLLQDWLTLASLQDEQVAVTPSRAPAWSSRLVFTPPWLGPARGATQPAAFASFRSARRSRACDYFWRPCPFRPQWRPRCNSCLIVSD